MKCFSSFLNVNVQQIQGMQEHDWGGEEKEHDEQASVDADGSCPPLPVRDRKVLPGEIVQQSPLTQHKNTLSLQYKKLHWKSNSAELLWQYLSNYWSSQKNKEETYMI